MPAGDAAATLVEMKFGSHLYGTSTPASDLDLKSVFVPPACDILLQRINATVTSARPKQPFEKNTAGEIDHEAFALHRYLRLLADGQTIALDMLFAPAWAMTRPPAPVWTEIVANRTRLLTRRAAGFVAYCRAQANKYGLKGSRIHAVRRVLAWFDAAIAAHGHLARLEAAADTLPDFITREGLDHTAIVLIPHPSRPDPIPHLSCCDRKAPFFSSLKDARAIYARLLDEYGARALMAERNEGVDWKALSHAVRIGHEAVELLTTGWITFPSPNAAHVLAVKLGSVPYAAVAEEIEDLLAQVEAARERSALPEAPDFGFIDDLVIAAYHDAVCSGLAERASLP